MTHHELVHLLYEWQYVIYAGGVLGIVLILYLAVNK